jgi:hypothetical protein
MTISVSVYAALLFFALTPNIFLHIPKNGSKYMVAAVHAVVFGIIFYLTHKFVLKSTRNLEGFTEGLLTCDEIKKRNVKEGNVTTDFGRHGCQKEYVEKGCITKDGYICKKNNNNINIFTWEKK